MTQSDETGTDCKGKETSSDRWPLPSGMEGENETRKADAKSDDDPHQTHIMDSISWTEQDGPHEQER